MGKHPYDRIAETLSWIHVSFSIELKVLMTCTDNDWNIVKAFAEKCASQADHSSSVGTMIVEGSKNATDDADTGENEEETKSAALKLVLM